MNHPIQTTGGRGISVCDRWLGNDGYDNFIADMGERPEGTSLERGDNSKGYNPDNCYWATYVQQGSNTRVAIQIIINGKTQCLSAWAREVGISPTAFSNRVKRGETGETLLRPSHCYPKNQNRERKLERALMILYKNFGHLDYEGKNEIDSFISHLQLNPMELPILTGA